MENKMMDDQEEEIEVGDRQPGLMLYLNLGLFLASLIMLVFMSFHHA